MFDKSYFERLQDYIQSGCKYQLSPEEQEYYNALFAVVGITRKYGKDRAISMLMHEPFNCSRPRAREMYYEAVNLFYLDDTIEPAAHRNMIFDSLMKAAQAVLLSSTSAKDMEVYGNLLTQAWKVKQLDKPDKVKRLDSKKPVLVCGDLNVAHKEIDLKNPKTNRMNAGFTDQEREKFQTLLDAGFIDTFRHFYPDMENIYSWWSYRFKAREKNAGWRIDYFVASARLADKLQGAKIHTEIFGSDHCPVEVTIDL